MASPIRAGQRPPHTLYSYPVHDASHLNALQESGSIRINLDTMKASGSLSVLDDQTPKQIALKYGVDAYDLVARNLVTYPSLTVVSKLLGGTVLTLPSGGEHVRRSLVGTDPDRH